VTVNPDIPEAHRLRGWYDSVGRSAEMSPLSTSLGGQSMAPGGQSDERILITQITGNHLGQSDKVPDFCYMCLSYIHSVFTVLYSPITLQSKQPWFISKQKMSIM
jgi:hypothetical protein